MCIRVNGMCQGMGCVCKCRSECENIYGEMDVVLEIIVCVQICQYVCIKMSMWF